MAEPIAINVPHETPPLERAVNGLRANQHARVLIAGVIAEKNFPEKEWREHPQILFWTGDEANTRIIPQAVKLILVTRFMNHTAFKRLNDFSRATNAVFSVNTLGVGEIKKLLAPLVYGPNHHAEPEPDPTTAPRPFARGELRAFLIEHGDLDATPYVLEAERVAKLAKARGFKVETSESIKQAMYLLRQDRDRQREMATTLANSHSAPALTMPTPVIPAPVLPSSAARPTPSPGLMTPLLPTATVTTSAPVVGTDEDAEIVSMLDDAMRKCEDAKAAMELTKAAILRRADKRRQLRDLLKEM